jgi:hypothetical protein
LRAGVILDTHVERQPVVGPHAGSYKTDRGSSPREPIRIEGPPMATISVFGENRRRVIDSTEGSRSGGEPSASSLSSKASKLRMKTS